MIHSPEGDDFIPDQFGSWGKEVRYDDINVDISFNELPTVWAKVVGITMSVSLRGDDVEAYTAIG